MNLIEEYLNRNALSCPGMPRPKERFNLIFEANTKIWKTSHVLMTITVCSEDQGGPNSYKVQMQTPQHNQGNHGGYGGANHAFKRVHESNKFFWQDYEREIIKLLNSKDIFEGIIRPVIDEDEVQIAALELFAFVNDSSVANIPFHLRKKLYDCLNGKFDIESRITSSKEFMSQLKTFEQSLSSTLEAFKASFFDKHNYAKWCGVLFNNFKNEQYKEQYSLAETMV